MSDQNKSESNELIWKAIGAIESLSDKVDKITVKISEISICIDMIKKDVYKLEKLNTSNSDSEEK